VEKLLLTPTEQLKAINDEAMAVAYADAVNKLFSLTTEEKPQSQSEPAGRNPTEKAS
jgi:hypothetical protein